MQQFKVGDWVRVDGEIKQYDTSQFFCDKWYNNIELWYPNENDWCVFHNGFIEDATNTFTVAKFQKFKDGKYPIVSCYGKFTEVFKYCEPFIGELPTFLKDK